MEITGDKILKYITDKRTRHSHYNKSVDLYDAMRIHFDGEYPEKLIGVRRPAETDTVKNYRRSIDVPITKATLSQVISSLQKARRSPDWLVFFDNTKIPPSIRAGERPDEYLNYNMPRYGSITNWCFAELLRAYCMDANGWLVVMPQKFTVADDREYIKPVPMLFHAPRVLDYVEDEYIVLLSDRKSSYKKDAEVVYFIDREIISVYERTKAGMVISEEYYHNLGYLPAIKTKGVVVESGSDTTLCESRLAPMLPYLDEARREYSDLQAEVVQHIHATMWYYATQVCKTCGGVGKIKNADNSWTLCPSGCDNGRMPGFNPYEAIEVKSPEIGSSISSLPAPPAGYIAKDTTIVTVQDQRIEKHIYNALSAINMQFLTSTPLNTSGVAKEIDKDELNNFVYSIYEDVIHIMNFYASTTIDLRYREIVTNEDARILMNPKINVPQKLELMNTAYLLNDIKNMKDAGVDNSMIKAAQIELAGKVFAANDDLQKKAEASITLDTLFGKSDDDINIGVQFGYITKVDATVHANIVKFIDRAIDEKGPGFYTMNYRDQMELIDSYAKEQLNGQQTG